MPTLTQLEYILAVDRLKRFGEAARACGVSQPSLSAQIRKVEEEMGFAIFDRGKQPVIATEKGARLIDQAKTVLREQRKLVDLARHDTDEVGGDFRLGVIPTISPYLIPVFLDKFAKRYPKVSLRIDEMKTEDIVRALRQDELDGGILATPLHEGGLTERPLYYESFHLYLNAAHPLLKKKRISEDELPEDEMWLLQDGHCLRQQIVKLCKPGGGAYGNVRFEGGNLETLRYLVKKGKGATILPYSFIETLTETERKNYVRDFELPAPAREVSLVHRRDQWKADILGALEKTVREAIPEGLKPTLDRKAVHVLGL